MDYNLDSPVHITSPFPQRLWAMVTQRPDGAVRWSGDGKTVIIDLDRFSDQANIQYPGLINSTNVKSFKRLLCKYGFRVMSNTDTRYGRCSVVYHPYFQRGRPDLLSCIQRMDKTNSNKPCINLASGLSVSRSSGRETTNTYLPAELTGNATLNDPYGIYTPSNFAMPAADDSDNDNDDDDEFRESAYEYHGSSNSHKFPKIKLNNQLKTRGRAQCEPSMKNKRPIQRRRKEQKRSKKNNNNPTEKSCDGEKSSSCHGCCQHCRCHNSDRCHNRDSCHTKTQTVLLPFLLTPQGYVPLAPAQNPLGLDANAISGNNFVQSLMEAPMFENNNVPQCSATSSGAIVSSTVIKSEEDSMLENVPQSHRQSRENEGNMAWTLTSSDSTESLADQDQILANASALAWQTPMQRNPDSTA